MDWLFNKTKILYRNRMTTILHAHVEPIKRFYNRVSIKELALLSSA